MGATLAAGSSEITFWACWESSRVRTDRPAVVVLVPNELKLGVECVADKLGEWVFSSCLPGHEAHRGAGHLVPIMVDIDGAVRAWHQLAFTSGKRPIWMKWSSTLMYSRVVLRAFLNSGTGV